MKHNSIEFVIFNTMRYMIDERLDVWCESVSLPSGWDRSIHLSIRELERKEKYSYLNKQGRAVLSEYRRLTANKHPVELF